MPRLVKDMTGTAPILLLDEVVAHLDPGRRAALYDELTSLGAQVWMTGADPALFAEIGDRAQVFEVSPGRVGAKRLTRYFAADDDFHGFRGGKRPIFRRLKS